MVAKCSEHGKGEGLTLLSWLLPGSSVSNDLGYDVNVLLGAWFSGLDFMVGV